MRHNPAFSTSAITLALAAHTGFGLYVVLVKYLLDYVPPFAMLAVAYCLAVPVAFFVGRRSLNWRVFGDAEVWFLLGTVVARSVSKVLAVQFTLATYVQLIDLIVPFLTAIMAWMLLREPIPSRTFSALGAVCLGSFLVITGNPFHIQLPNGRADLIGVAIALVSSLMMAFGVVYTRRLTAGKQSPAQVFFQVAVAMGVSYGILSALTDEGWQLFASLGISTWIVYGLFIIFAVIGAGLTQVLAISRTNATLFSTLLSWRLVVAATAGWILLGERLTTIWQAIGIVVVIVSITLYVQHQAAQV